MPIKPLKMRNESMERLCWSDTRESVYWTQCLARNIQLQEGITLRADCSILKMTYILIITQSVCIHFGRGAPLDWTDLYASLVSHTLYPEASGSCFESRELMFLNHIKTNHQIKRRLPSISNAKARQGECYLKNIPSGVTLSLVVVGNLGV